MRVRLRGVFVQVILVTACEMNARHEHRGPEEGTREAVLAVRANGLLDARS
jgi:hypothetical protein